MKEYFISIQGQRVSVTQEIYEAYYKMERRFRYYEYDIKAERVVRKNGGEMRLPGKEDSYDRLQGLGCAPGTQPDEVETEVQHRLLREMLYAAMKTLSEDECSILWELYWNRKSERELSRQTGIAQKTINDRKKRILQKLRLILKDIDQ